MAAATVYVADGASYAVKKLDRVDAPSLSFAATAVGSTTSPHSLTVENIGNAILTGSVQSISANFAQIAGPGMPPDCAAGFSLAPADACNLSLIFTPESAGSINGSAILFSNSLNGTDVEATIELSGTGNQGTPTITWANPAAITYGTALGTAQLNATASVPGTFTYTPALGTVLAAGPQTLNVTFTPTDATDYQSATASVTLTVNKVTPALTWANPAAITYGTALSQAQLNATASVPGTFAYAPALGTALAAGPQTLKVTFTPTDKTDDQSATAGVALTVNQASQSITFGSIALQVVGNIVNLSASSTSGLAVSFASTTPSVCSVSGVTATMLATGTCSIQATQPGSSNYAAAMPVGISFTVTAASTFKLNATPNSETIHRGIAAIFLLDAQSVNGFSGNVTITCSGGPNPSVCGSLPQTIKLKPNQTSLAISGILFPKNAAPGAYTLTFTGTSGATVVSTTAQFKVQD